MNDVFNKPAWHAHAACSAANPSLFFPAHGESMEDAKAVCQACPVRSECLRYAIANGERYGIWGGQSAFERRRNRRGIAA